MSSLEIIGCVIAALGIVLALGFTAVPVLPGALFVLLGAIGFGLVVDFEPFSVWFWVGQAVLTALYLLADNLAQVYGIRRAGGSAQAVIGASIGVLLGPFVFALVMGPFALFVGPIAGAVIGAVLGERYARSHSTTNDLVRTGKGAIISFILGTAMKFALVAMQVGWLLFALVRYF